MRYNNGLHPFFWIGITIIFVSLMLTRCASANTGAGSDVLGGAEQLGKLQAENAELTRQLDYESSIREHLRGTLGVAEEYVAGTRGDIERAIELLRVYKLAIDRYFESADNYKTATGAQE